MKTCPKCQAPVPSEAPQGLCPKCLLASVSSGTEHGQPAEPPNVLSLAELASVFPQLEILEFIGQGGMGLVYKARQRQLDRLVALKLLPQRPGSDPTFGERFTREARVLARLNHPNIVAVYDFGRAAGFYYLMMEFVDGVNLRQAMRAGRFTPPQALALVPKICDALQYAHEEGVLHRDIKPENLLLDARGRVKIADFGIAKLLGENADLTLTASGAAIGTPHYMAPEQLERPHEVDQRADIFSLGVVFYEMLTGELPIGRFAPPSEKADVDARIDQIVLRTLEKERERRFQSAGEVKTRVENITSGSAQAGGGIIGVPYQAASSSGSPAGQNPAAAAGAAGLKVEPDSWPRRVLASFALVGISVAGLLLGLLAIVASRAHPGAALVLFFIMAVPGGIGTLLAWSALRKIIPGTIQRQRLLALRVAALAWPLLLCDMALFFALVLSARNFEAHVLHTNNAPLTVLSAIVAVFGIAALNWSLGREWAKRWQHEPLAMPFAWAFNQPGRFRRFTVWGSGLVGVLILLILFRGAFNAQSRLEPPQVISAALPTAPRGYAIPGGIMQGNDWTFHTGMSVPAGYALTLTVTLWSNQMPVKATENSAFIISPAREQVHGQLTWKLLGNGALADGAPLQFSIGLDQLPEARRTTFHIVTPQPVAVDWVGQPNQLWPPEEGRTKYLLLKGNSSTAAVSPPSNSSDAQIPTGGNNPQLLNSGGTEDTAEWAVGIEARLDPIPPRLLHSLAKPQVGLGSDWIAQSERNSPAEGEEIKSESQSSNP
jgi:predicted Ser/Thr protein kinase